MSNRPSKPEQRPEAERQAQTKQRPAPASRRKARPERKRKPFVLQRLRRQEIFLLTGLLSLACFSVIVVGLLILRFQSASARSEISQPGKVSGPQPTHTVTFVEITALSQYRLAEVEAQNWSEDAQLVSANTNWPGVLNKEQIGAPSQWTYRFYSPGKERLFIVKVEPDGQLQRVEHVVRITLPPPVLGTGSWVIDSPAALAIWLDHGGADLVRRNPGLEVLIQLRHLDDHPNPVWAVIGTDTRTQSVHIVVVDTIEGTVVTTKSSD